MAEVAATEFRDLERTLEDRRQKVAAAGWPGGPDDSVRAEVAREPARAIGLDGMIAGQSVDLRMTDRATDSPTLELIHSRKTDALFTASAALGDMGAGARPAEAGKDVGKDLKKTTFVSFSGVQGARARAGELIEASEAALAPFGARAEPLRALARDVVTRRR